MKFLDVMRYVVGVKRYIHGKRLRGFLIVKVHKPPALAHHCHPFPHVSLLPGLIEMLARLFG